MLDIQDLELGQGAEALAGQTVSVHYTGRLTDGLRIVLQGLQPGETVIVNGLQRVRPGVVVAPERIAMDAREVAEAKLAMSGGHS